MKSKKHPFSSAIESLSQVLVQLVTLDLLTKQLHWNVRGPNFKPIHEQLDQISETLRELSDEVAERLLALEVPADGRLGTLQSQTVLKDIKAGFIQGKAAVKVMHDGIKKVVSVLREAIEACESEPVTQDLFVEATSKLEKHAWMLGAQLD